MKNYKILAIGLLILFLVIGGYSLLSGDGATQNTPTGSGEPTASASGAPRATTSPKTSTSATPTTTGSPLATSTRTTTPTASPTAKPSATPTVTPRPTTTPTPTPAPTPTPTPTPTASPTPTPAPSIRTVTITEFSYAPATLTVTKGDLIDFKNMGSMMHTVTADGGEFNSGSLQPMTGIFRLNTATLMPGPHSYKCLFHPGMTGTIIVQ